MGDKLIRKGLAAGIIILFIGSNFVFGLNIQLKTTGPLITGRGNTLYIGGTGEGNYSKIQDAIDNASDGDTVFVYDDSSPYYENVVVDKSLNLIGEDKDTTIIDGSKIGDVVSIIVDWVNISGFTIRNSRAWDYDAGIKMYSKHTIINGNNIISNNNVGLWLSYSSRNTIISNNISNNGNGIYFILSSDNIIIGNNINSNNLDGMYLVDSKFNHILKNNFLDNGLDAFFSNEIDLFALRNRWYQNYWEQPRILPKPIFGEIYWFPEYPYWQPYHIFWIPQFDWHPAQKPYDIGV